VNGVDLPEATIGVNAHLLPGTSLNLDLFGLNATATNHVDTTQPFARTISAADLQTTLQAARSVDAATTQITPRTPRGLLVLLGALVGARAGVGKDALAWYRRGLARADAGDIAGARADLEQALKLDPSLAARVREP
jgi:hypothetical protein